ncbi:hypothetical protein AB0D04_20880 [Streptomyces sp. NPDC048483]|uniref:hypothetical protein n=1 Tax=Streptomyces sp. NPDC048483 TaxID=3154927 RepID=UPI003437275B
MGSPQLIFCAAVAACVVTTAPAYADDERGAATGTVSVTPAAAAPGAAVTLHLSGCDAAKATAESPAFAATVPLARTAGRDGHGLAGGARIRGKAALGTHPVTVACPATGGRAASATATGTVRVRVRVHQAPSSDPASSERDSSERAAAHRELSSTSAVGLVLSGGALLVVAGQVLRLRLRLRREREGGGGGDAS